MSKSDKSCFRRNGKSPPRTAIRGGALGESMPDSCYISLPNGIIAYAILKSNIPKLFFDYTVIFLASCSAATS